MKQEKQCKTTIEKTIRAQVIGGLTGLVLGAVGGVVVGEAANDYFEVLQESPKALQYAVDAGGAIAGAYIGTALMGALAAVPGFLKYTKENREEDD